MYWWDTKSLKLDTWKYFSIQGCYALQLDLNFAKSLFREPSNLKAAMIRAEALFYTCRYRIRSKLVFYLQNSQRFEHALLFYHQGLVCEAYITVWTPLITRSWTMTMTISMTMTIDHVHDHDNEHDQCSWPGASTWESGVQTRRGKMQENHLQHVASVDFSSDHFIIFTNPFCLPGCFGALFFPRLPGDVKAC